MLFCYSDMDISWSWCYRSDLQDTYPCLRSIQTGQGQPYSDIACYIGLPLAVMTVFKAWYVICRSCGSSFHHDLSMCYDVFLSLQERGICRPSEQLQLLCDVADTLSQVLRNVLLADDSNARTGQGPDFMVQAKAISGRRPAPGPALPNT